MRDAIHEVVPLMSALIAAAVLLVLGAVALLHAYWAVGGVWPGRDPRELAATVIGLPHLRRMPSAPVTFATAAMIGAAGVFPWVAPLALPRLLVTAGLYALAAVFLGRGAVGFTPAWRRRHSLEPFTRLDRVLYSPLCLVLGAGFLLLGVAS